MQTYIDCLHIKKTDKSRLLLADQMDCDNSTTNKIVEDENADYQDKVLIYKNIMNLLDMWHYVGDLYNN